MIYVYLDTYSWLEYSDSKVFVGSILNFIQIFWFLIRTYNILFKF